MKKCNDPKVKKTSDEEAQGPVEETEAKKGEEEEKKPEEVEKGMEQSEAHMTDQTTMLREILTTLKQLVATDKMVHNEVGKADDEKEDEMEEKKEEKEEKKVEKAEVPPPTPAEDKTALIKAEMEQEFQKALDAKIAPLQEQIDFLKAEVQKLGDEPLYKSGILLNPLTTDAEGKPEMGNAAALAAQRKKQQKV
jgi:hypothetical protein